MKPQSVTSSQNAAGITIQDILYILFRRKWIVLIGCLVAVTATLVLRVKTPTPFQSDARLYIRYVVESRSPTPDNGNDSQRIKAPGGDTVLNTELQILTSMDLARQVAAVIGPEEVVGKSQGTNSLEKAAVVIRKGLVAQVQNNSSVIELEFQHTNPEIVQRILKELIASYFKKHAEIHAVGAFDQFLTEETDQRRSRLAETERELREALASAGVISLSESRESYAGQILRLQEQLLNTEAELAQQRATVNEIAKAFQTPASTAATNAIPPTNAPLAAVPTETLVDYRRVCGLVETLSKREQEMSLIYTASNRLVLEIREQLAANEQKKKALEESNPGLTASIATTGVASPGQPARESTLLTETARVSGLESKVQMLRNQLTNVLAKAESLAQAEGKITELERRRNLLETNYALFSTSLDRAQMDERIGAGKVSNISIIQEPTPPAGAPGKLLKTMCLVFFGGVALAFGLAFLLELYIDETVKRPIEVEKKLRLPLFISIPVQKGPAQVNGSHQRLLEAPFKEGDSGDKTPEKTTQASSPDSKMSLALWDPRHPLQPFWEALRDRLVTFFELKQMTHKPKLVAVTSCGDGSGVSTVSAGLAASLSETGEGNVLLVDMNTQNGAAHQFCRGDLDCGIDDALESSRRDHVQVQENLYVVSEAPDADKLPAILPKRFKHLVPKLKASDYDYIIFDMPAVSQISLTPRLAKFMDMVLLVVQSEHTHRDAVKHAAELLSETQPNIGIVLNQVRGYVPKGLGPQL